MKILHLVQHFYPCTGGIETYVLGLCRQLVKAGHTSDVACLDTCSSGTEKLPSYEKFDGIRIHRVPYIDLKYYKPSLLFLRFMRNYDVIHVHGIGFLSDMASLTRMLHKKPIVLHTHGGVFHTKNISSAKSLYFNIWNRIVLKGVKIIAISRNDQKIFSGISNNVTLVPNAIDLIKYKRIKRRPKKNSFVYVGRLAPNKRLDNLLRTAAFLKKEIPRLKLTIAGEDWQGVRGSLETLSRDLGIQENVVFTGKVSDKEKISLLASSEFFVSSSEYEGFGIAVLEAMASGLPVIVNNIGPFRRLIDSGKNGFIVDFSSPRLAAKQILGIRKKELSRISSLEKKTTEKYDWKVIIKKIENVYLDASGK